MPHHMSKLLNVLKLLFFTHRRKVAQQLHFLTFFKSLTGAPTQGQDDQDTISRYWPCKSLPQVIEEADRLFAQNEYLRVYETLNRVKWGDNVQVQWRLGRALFKLSFQQEIKAETRRDMIEEAYDIIGVSLRDFGENNAQVHKWAAIITDRRNGMQGLDSRVRGADKVKDHLVRCCQLDPKDVTAQYLLGRWCYEMSNITWFQRVLAKLLYGEPPPQSTYEEAHKHLAKAEELQPRFYLQNTYLLGKTCLKLGQYYSAKHYFEVVGNLTCHTEYDQQCAADAKKMLKRLDKYSLEKGALFYEYPFGTNE